MGLFDLNNYMAEMVYEYIPNVKRVGSNKLNFRCPLCGDGKKSTSHRGWFYIDTGSYYCWNAGCIANETGMQGLKFLSIISGKSINEVKQDLIQKAGTFSNALDKKDIKNMDIALFDDDSANEIKIKKQSKMISDKLECGEWTSQLPKFVQAYIDNRKLMKAPYIPVGFSFYYDKKNKRLVIPWNDSYYQERKMLSSQKNEDKYKFPPEIEKPIFGLENLDKSFKYIFVLEGVFDSIWVKNGIATGSLTLSAHQKEILKEYEKDYTIVYMPDNQFADKSSMQKSIKFCKDDPFANVFIWPIVLNKFKDVNETTIFSDKCIELWKSEKFLIQNIANGAKGLLKLIK